MQNDAYNILNTIISALLLTLPFLAPKSTSMHSICPHLKCIWNSRTEVGVEKPDRAELQFPGDMFSKHPKISQGEMFHLVTLGFGSTHCSFSHSASHGDGNMITSNDLSCCRVFFLLPLPC